MIFILTATAEEFELAKKHLKGYPIIKTGVGASNVIKTISEIPEQMHSAKFVNVGFCGSNKIPIGTVTKVSQTFRLVDENVEFEDYRNGYWLAAAGYPCYTSNSFVTKSISDEPAIYDMELNYIAAFPINLVGAVKIVSDNLDVCEYEKTIDSTSAELWKEVREKVEGILKSTK